MAAADKAIEASGLEKRYRDVVALAGVDLEVESGIVFGLLGPNGAGKTTAVRILTTLLSSPTRAARASPGSTCAAKPARLRERIGLAGQYAAVDENLTGFENLEMVGRLYHLDRRAARDRARRAARRTSTSPRRAAGSCARTRAACGDGSTWPRLSSRVRRCCSSTSRRPVSTRAAGSRSGRRSRGSSRTGRPCC